MEYQMLLNLTRRHYKILCIKNEKKKLTEFVFRSWCEDFGTLLMKMKGCHVSASKKISKADRL